MSSFRSHMTGRPFQTAALTAALSVTLALPMAGPAAAKSTGGLLGSAVGSALRHAGGGDEGVTAVEGMVSAAAPETIVAVLQDKGYRAELETDAQGDPLISSAAAGANFRIYFYGCVDNAGCDSVLFSAGFDMDDGLPEARINEWNRDAVIGRGYVDEEQDPYLESYVLTRGGIPPEVFAYALEEWSQVLGDFQEFIGW